MNGLDSWFEYWCKNGLSDMMEIPYDNKTQNVTFDEFPEISMGFGKLMQSITEDMLSLTHVRQEITPFQNLTIFWAGYRHSEIAKNR